MVGTDVDLRGAFPPGEHERAEAHTATLASLSVDRSVVAGLAVSELGELLPDASVVDRVRILGHLRAGRSGCAIGAARPEEGDAAGSALPLPDHPSWAGIRRWFEAVDWDPQAAREKAMQQTDCTSVPASLVLAITAAALLEPPWCDDAARSPFCARLSAADMIAWMVTTVLMMQSVLSAAAGTSLIRLQRDGEINAWLAANWFHVMQPFVYFAIGVAFMLPLALSLRMWLLLQDASRAVAIVLIVIPWTMPVSFFLAWANPSRRVMGMSWRDWAHWNNGYCWGMVRGPTRAEWYRLYQTNKNSRI